MTTTRGADDTDEGVTYITPELRASIMEKKPALLVPNKDMRTVEERLGALETTTDTILERMEQVLTIAQMVGAQISPILNEISNGPIGKLLGIKNKGR